MPSPIPDRERAVYIVGAGLPSAFNLPNTPSLLQEVATFAGTAAGRWISQDAGLVDQLKEAYKFFYPDARYEGFQPDVVDFFSTLRTYLDIGVGLAGTGFQHAPEMYRNLRRAVAHLLITRLRAVDETRFASHQYLSEMIQPGHIIVTSNWDLLVEHFCRLNGIPMRLGSINRKMSTSHVTLLKLHGSIDWGQVSARPSGRPTSDYAALRELQFGSPYTLALPKKADELLRVRDVPLGFAWQQIKARLREPYIVTMATGKSDDLGPLLDVWKDAYSAISRAAHLHIVGYSMPPDDVEVRTLLRTGIQRGTSPPRVWVQNPAPDVHVRVRTYLTRAARVGGIAVCTRPGNDACSLSGVSR